MAKNEFGPFVSDGVMRMRATMRRKRITQYEVAVAIGERQAQVHRWSWGEAEVPLDVAAKLGRFFGIDPILFLPRSQKKTIEKIRSVA